MDELMQQLAVTLEEKHDPITVIGGQRGGGKIFFLENMVKFLKEQLKQEKVETERWKSAALYYADKCTSVQQWRSRQDPPTEMGKYLCRCVYGAEEDYAFEQVLWYYPRLEKPHFQNEGSMGLKVTHWMPLPEPPKP